MISLPVNLEHNLTYDPVCRSLLLDILIEFLYTVNYKQNFMIKAKIDRMNQNFIIKFFLF